MRVTLVITVVVLTFAALSPVAAAKRSPDLVRYAKQADATRTDGFRMGARSADGYRMGARSADGYRMGARSADGFRMGARAPMRRQLR